MTRSDSVLILTPTDRERRGLDPTRVPTSIELCGFGPVAAGVRAAQLATERCPARIILVGIAGTYDETHAPVGSAVIVDRVHLDGVGVEPGRLGFPQFTGSTPDGRDTVIEDRLDLPAPSSPSLAPSRPTTTLLTVTTPSQSASEADRRRERFDAQLEDMEGFAVALACRLAGKPLTIVRGISNRAGDRDHRNWRIDDALASASDLMCRVIELERGAP